ncbi:phytoene/squalene synthase family protein [Staphylococcus hominis]|uniref:phytoene/squalene synthase family protein n=1 Tax=Staphylococcus hominis TaxID=1290 RepID=UPI000D1E6782|nr:phytoene/squalene synthase family protein [Staphylococcus hominis]MCE4974584.1 phytoene/squalene synthase family protein [Staphylococcus hominis]PTK22568.1 dehydrosqualene synthase [Staphylococcus hominis]PTK37155.1 dehydrosqualene synthase [Staphylococcus hominis]RIO53344.1 phytoene/squalene synthase family protein [Staphylococcus hominis]
MSFVEESYQYCHKIMKDYSKSFSFAFDLLPERQRRAIWAIYSVCRIIDDSIDIHQDVDYLYKIKQDVQRIEHQSDIQKLFESDQHIMTAFADTAQTFPMNYYALYELIDTVMNDQYFTMFDTDAALMDYCYGVAGTVGVLLIPVLSTSPTKETYENGKQLGEALQLTNILRDVGEDYHNGRVYLSIERLEQCGVLMDNEMNSGPSEEYKKLWEYYATIAENDYEAVLNHLDVYDKEARFIIELAARVYKSILDETRKANYTFSQRVYVSKWKKNHIYRELKKEYKVKE